MSDQQYPPLPPRPAGQPQAPRGGVPHHPPMGGQRPPMPPFGMKMPPNGAKMPFPAGKRPPMPMPAGMKAPFPHPAPQQHPAPYAAPLPSVVEDDDGTGIIDDLGYDDEEETVEPEEEEAVVETDENVRFESSPYDDNMAADMGLPAGFIKTKVLIPLFLLFIAAGVGIGMFLGNPQQKASDELPGVVSNPEIPKGRPRCGIAQKGQGCVIYVMNAQRREMQAKDFFGIAADMLQIPKFQIETANIRYATTRVPPGYIVLLNVPPVQ